MSASASPGSPAAMKPVTSTNLRAQGDELKEKGAAASKKSDKRKARQRARRAKKVAMRAASVDTINEEEDHDQSDASSMDEAEINPEYTIWWDHHLDVFCNNSKGIDSATRDRGCAFLYGDFMIMGLIYDSMDTDRGGFLYDDKKVDLDGFYGDDMMMGLLNDGMGFNDDGFVDEDMEMGFDAFYYMDSEKRRDSLTEEDTSSSEDNDMSAKEELYGD